MEEKTKVKVEEIESVKKVNRRGVATTRGTTRLKFSHELSKPNGLFLAHLDSVTVNNITIGEDKTGLPSFNGCEVPRIVFTFASNEEEINKRHYVNLSFTAIESNVNTIPGGKEEWKVNSVLDWFNHIINVFVLKGKEFTDEEADALSLPFEDFDENQEYIPVETETVIAGWRTLFENVENLLNRGNNGNPYYKSKDNKNIPIWIKLLRYIKNNKKGWTPISNGDLSFPSFVGEGCIEIYKPNTPAAIRVDTIKEAIIPMNIEKPKAPNTPNISSMNSMAGGIPVMDNIGSMSVNNIAAEAMEDMPF